MDRLAELRERRALTLRELSEMSGVAADTINQIELGHRRARPSTLRKLARALEVDVREFFEEPALAGKAEAPQETGQQDEERSVRDIAQAEARRQNKKDRQAFRISAASEGIDPATRIADPYDRGVYDVLRRQPADELAGALLDAEHDYIHAAQETALLKEEIARLKEEIARLRDKAEQESVHR